MDNNSVSFMDELSEAQRKALKGLETTNPRLAASLKRAIEYGDGLRARNDAMERELGIVKKRLND